MILTDKNSRMTTDIGQDSACLDTEGIEFMQASQAEKTQHPPIVSSFLVWSSLSKSQPHHSKIIIKKKKKKNLKMMTECTCWHGVWVDRNRDSQNSLLQLVNSIFVNKHSPN